MVAFSYPEQKEKIELLIRAFEMILSWPDPAPAPESESSEAKEPAPESCDSPEGGGNE